MKWLKNLVIKWVREDWNAAQDCSTDHAKLSSNRTRDYFETDDGLNMQLYKAIGGRIVSFNHYDRKTDRNYRKVYIVPDDMDFERELSKIITIESMRG